MTQGTNGAIVVLTREDDEHLPFVQRHLKEPMVIIDPYEIARGRPLTFNFDGGNSFVEYNTHILHSVKSLWYRKPGNLELDQVKVASAYRTYADSAIESHVRMLRSHFPDALWISDYHHIQRARSKAYQHLVASTLRFNIPDTILTSDKRAADAFLASHEEVIVKSLGDSFPGTDKLTSFFFAKKLKRGEKLNLANLHMAPAIFQQAIDTVVDLRVTVVGKHVFAASIQSDSQQRRPGVRDWRYEYREGDNLFKTYALPKKVAEQCIDLVARLNLSYGAIDFVVDRQGKIWFLEINPNGQWAFVEEDTGLPIGKAIADALEKGSL